MKRHTYQIITLLRLSTVVAMLLCGTMANAQVNYGPSDSSEEMDCGQYQWPAVQSSCPEVLIKQKYDHIPLKQYQAEGWDTVVSCHTPSITLSCMPYKPVQYFNGQYLVDEIPFNPADPTFAQGTKMPVSTDDDFAAEASSIPFSFFFFGYEKTQFVLGANGLVTFNTDAAGRYCPWKYSATLPWPSTGKTGVPAALDCTVNHMRDAIYGIYEDTHPIAAYLSGDQGIYYGVQGEYPCRKIICSWKGIPTFPGIRNLDNRCTYQIVCYEGSNLIEVHILRRGKNADWQGGRGLIGIQNATGVAQEKGSAGQPNYFVVNGAHPAYYPTNGNFLTEELDSVAYRFSPQGNNTAEYEWLRILSDTTVKLTSINEGIEDTNGYYIPMGQVMSTCPTLTTAEVSPTVPSRYVFHMWFKNAKGQLYDLYDTIHVGIDFSNQLTLRPSSGTPADHQMNVCKGNNSQLMFEFPQLQDTLHTTLLLTHSVDGTPVALADSLLIIGTKYYDQQNRLNKIPMTLVYDSAALGMRSGKVDSIRVKYDVTFVSGCDTTVDLLILYQPKYDTVDNIAICEGDTVVWHMDGKSYTATTNKPYVAVATEAGCDSVVHLNLTVWERSYSIEEHFTCQPYTWLNGKTYYADNDATALQDTVVLRNIAGCDSIVQLDFSIRPLTARIEADIEYFDYNQPQVMLTDVSTGGESRRWLLPGDNNQTAPVVYFTADPSLDSANIILIARSPYGCVDSAYLTIPFRHDAIWMPNAFTPSATENNLFGSHSHQLLKEEMYIYNRFGSLVFQCDQIDCQWDGTDLNGNPCPQGSYVYIVRYTTLFEPHTTQVLKGTVTLIE